MIPPNYSNPNQPNQPQPQGATPNPTPLATPNKSKSSMKTFVPVVLSIGFLMLVAVAWLTYSSISTTRALEQKVADLEEAEKLRMELENQFDAAIAELDKLKGDNEQINALIEQQKAELEAQKNQISGLLREKKQLDAARAEIANLKTKVAQYVADIEQLRAEQEQLSEENSLLKSEKEELGFQLQSRSTENESLNIAKAQLVSERDELNKSVQIGSIVKVKDIQVTGQKVKKSGKTAKKDNAKRVDQLKVCFTTIVNDIVQPGKESFFIRIVSPEGETLAIDDLGSGATTDKKTGEEIRYTQVKEYDYANDETQLCFLWNPEVPFQKGKYNVEIYNKGYLSGSGQFELK
jgi:hypothetical protein